MINIFNYLLQVRKPDVLHFSVGKKKQTVEQATIRLTRTNPGLIAPATFRGCFFNLILYDFVQSFFSHICHGCQMQSSILGGVLYFNFQQLSRALSVRTWKKNARDLHGHPSPIVKIYFQKLAFLTPFVFLLLHRLVTCRPFSVKLSPSGTGCLLLSSLLRLSLPFDQQFDDTLSLICSPMVSINSSTILCLWYVLLWSLLVIFSHSFRRLPRFYLHFCVYVPTPFLFLVFFFVCVCCYFISQRKGPRLASCYWPILFKHIRSINK